MRSFSLRLLGASVALGAGVSVAVAQSGDVAVKQYDSGGVYEGEFKDGRQHGKGTFTLPGGYEYTGDWAEGKIQGVGVVKYPNGSVYEGEFMDGAPNGKARSSIPMVGTMMATGSMASSKDPAKRCMPMARNM